MKEIEQPVITIKGIGEKTASALNLAGIFSVNDLLMHYPKDYDLLEERTKIVDLVENNRQMIRATVLQKARVLRTGKMTIITVSIGDESGIATLVYFRMPYISKILLPGKEYYFRGKVRLENNQYKMYQPVIFSVEDYQRKIGRLLPLYELPVGISNSFFIKTIQKLLQHALQDQARGINWYEEYLPDGMLERLGYQSYLYALSQLHAPDSYELLQEARKRLVFDEFFVFLWKRNATSNRNAVTSTQAPWVMTAQVGRAIERLPYSLTNSQQKVLEEMICEVTSGHRMNRLLQGDVGSGKTIVAMLLMLLCATNKKQAAMMAPTEVLASQHYHTLVKLIEDNQLSISVALITSAVPTKKKQEWKESIQNGSVSLVIGTHALLQEDVVFSDLSLVITDEQHRFGVRQREYYREKGICPHSLVMSATPIPRTLALILYNDMNISVMDTMPSDRLPIKNCVVPPTYREKINAMILKEVRKGHQVYVICPSVVRGDTVEMESVEEKEWELRLSLPEEIRIASLHGKMNPKVKNRLMKEFTEGEYDVLVATTVVEVGIDVPNATLIVIEDAQRYGLASLHQIRGRVGRGVHQSYCVFINSGKQSQQERLEVLNRSNDGFYIASEDLRLRGPGEALGERQSGDFPFLLADIYADSSELETAKECLEKVLQSWTEIPQQKQKLLTDMLGEKDLQSIL